jgi:nucleotide-binding universal stress UspA family protein
MNIIIAYDNSSAAKLALERAKQHAVAFKARILVVTSMEGGSGESKDKVRKAEANLEKVKSRFDAQGIECETHLLIRGLTAGEDIVLFAQEKDADELIIGIKKRSKVGKLMFGSTAQYIILNAPCPVLAVK